MTRTTDAIEGRPQPVANHWIKIGGEPSKKWVYWKSPFISLPLQAPDRLRSAEELLDPLPDALVDRVAGPRRVRRSMSLRRPLVVWATQGVTFRNSVLLAVNAVEEVCG